MFTRFALALGLVAFVSVGAAAQTADEVVAKSIAAHGGAQKLKSVQTMRITGTMSMMGADFPITVEQKRPKMVRVDLNIEGTQNIQAYDGHDGWMFMPGQGMASPQPASADMLKDLDEQADMDLPYMDYKAKGNKVELDGKATVGGAETYKLKITLKNGDVRNYYLDAKSYLPVRTDSNRVVNDADDDRDADLGLPGRRRADDAAHDREPQPGVGAEGDRAEGRDQRADRGCAVQDAAGEVGGRERSKGNHATVRIRVFRVSPQVRDPRSRKRATTLPELRQRRHREVPFGVRGINAVGDARDRCLRGLPACREPCGLRHRALKSREHGALR